MVIVLYFILDVPYVNSPVKILFWRIDAVLGSVLLITQSNKAPSHCIINKRNAVNTCSFSHFKVRVSAYLGWNYSNAVKYAAQLKLQAA
jgi:hypothetical protein